MLSFDRQQAEQGFALKKIHFWDDTTGVAMGGTNFEFGVAQFTLDGGKTWSLDTMSQKIVRDFDVLGDNIFGIGIDNLVTQKEGLLPWEERGSPLGGQSNGLLKTETGFVLVGGISIKDGFVIRFSNNFADASIQEIDGEMNAIARASPTDFHMVGFGSIHRSDDAGATWMVNITDGDDYRDVFFINEAVGWIVGNAGSILKTEDGGLTWETLRKPTVHNKLKLNKIHFADEFLGAVVGDDGLVWITRDGGQNWIVVEEIPAENYSCLFVHSDFITVGSYDGHIIKLLL